MSHETFSSALYYRVCCFVLFFVAAAASFSGYYQKWHFAEPDISGDDASASIARMLDGTAEKPSIYRQLVPATANWMDRLVPQAEKDRMYAFEGSGEDAFLYAIADSPTANDPQYFFRYVVVYVETFLFALVAAYAMYFVCCAVGVSRTAAVFAPVIVLLLFPYFESGGGFYYDYPELAFFALAAWVALRFEWWWIAPIAASGTWNKETFVLIVLTLYPILRRKYSVRMAAFATVVLMGVCAAVYFPIHLHFARNPAGEPATWWRAQVHYFMNVKGLLFATEETYGIRMLRPMTLLPMALLAWTAVRGWRMLPRSIQRHAQVAAVINVPLFIFFCNPGEARNLSMLWLTFLLLVAGNLDRWQQSGMMAGVDSAGAAIRG